MGFLDRLKQWVFGAPEESAPRTVIVQMPAAVPPATESASAPREERRPVIGISGASGSSKSVASMMAQIRAAGAEPRFIGEHASRIKPGETVEQAVVRDLAGLDGLAVMGNDGDINPAKYGAVQDKATKVETDLARASYEETAIQKALDMGMPLLGICGGMQRMNVLGGGTLHQHVPDLVGDNHHMQGDIPPFVPVQVVTLTPGSKLAEIASNTRSVYTPGHQELPPGVVMENSFHHQAVKDLRSDFQVSATSEDHLVEAIEPKPGSRYANQYVMGIQWHPEFGASDLGPKIAGSVVSAAQAYAVTKSQGVFEEAPVVPLTGGALEKELLRRQQNSVMMRA